MKTTTTRIAALTLAVPLALAGCSASGDKAPTGTGTPAAQSAQQSTDPFAAAPGTEVDKATFLQQTQQAVQDKKTYSMNMTMSMQGQQLGMTGAADIADPAKPRITMTMKAPSGQQGSMNMIIADDTMFMQSPQGDGTYMKMPLAQLTAQTGQDFKKLMNPAESLKLQQEAIDKVTYVGEEDVNGTKLRHYTAVLDLAKAQKLTGQTQAPVPTATDGTTKTPYDVWVDGDKLMRKVSMTVQGSKIDMTMDKFGEPVEITTPPADKVREAPALPQQSASPTKG